MRAFRDLFLVAALFATPMLLCLTGSRAVVCPALAGDAIARPTAARQFYTRVLGHWVGTTVSRVVGEEPVTGYFHLVITRVDENTFREEYLFYRILPDTGVMERSGTQSYVSTIESDGIIHRTCRGSGTIMIDFQPKNQSFEASGEVHVTSPDHLEAEVQGKIAVDGMPLGMGKHGKLRKATATLSLENDKLIVQTRFEASFRVLLFTKRYRIETQLRAQRGDNLQTVTGRAPTP